MPSIRPRWHQGIVSRQAHRDLPAGTFEREVGREGFDGPSTQFYHRRPPTNWTKFTGNLCPRAWNLSEHPSCANLFEVDSILSSNSVSVRYWHVQQPTPQSLTRNSDGDLILFLHRGECDFYCDYGHLEVESGDYLVIPKGTMWRVHAAHVLHWLVIETKGQRVRIPKRGLLGNHALFDPAKLDIPQIDQEFDSQEDQPYQVLVKRQDEISTIDYPYNPLDAVGWIGDLAPVRLNVRDILPVNSHRYHLPPSVHATFEADRLLVSTFVPRPFETDETALKVPFFHSNDDVDEVIFYHDGDFFSRDGIQPGSLSFHPAGFTHGPQKKAQSNMFKQTKTHTNEVAVMLDAFDPLVVNDHTIAGNPASAEPLKAEANGSFEVKDYVDRWHN